MFQKKSDEQEGVHFPPRHLLYYFNDFGNAVVIKKIKEIDWTVLESLNLAHTKIGDPVIDPLIEFFVNKTGVVLTELNLSGNDFTDQGIERLLKAIQSSPHCPLQKLLLTGNSQLSPSVLEQANTVFSAKKKTYSF